jgi:hypothetical protein
MLIMSIGVTLTMFMLAVMMLMASGFSRFSNYLTYHRATSTAHACTNYSTCSAAAYFTSNYSTTSTTHRATDYSARLTFAFGSDCTTYAAADSAANYLTSATANYTTNRSARSCT